MSKKHQPRCLDEKADITNSVSLCATAPATHKDSSNSASLDSALTFQIFLKLSDPRLLCPLQTLFYFPLKRQKNPQNKPGHDARQTRQAGVKLLLVGWIQTDKQTNWQTHIFSFLHCRVGKPNNPLVGRLYERGYFWNCFWPFIYTQPQFLGSWIGLFVKAGGTLTKRSASRCHGMTGNLR